MRALLLLCLLPSAFAACPDGTTYDSRFNKCYKFVRRATNFRLAQMTCESMGGSLVSISNAFENAFVSQIASANASPKLEFWIGINSIDSYNWTWANGDNSTYTNWAPGQPVQGSLSLCGVIQITDSQWTTVNYFYNRPYMCQIAPNAATVPGSCPDGHCPDLSYTLNPITCKCFKESPGPPKSYNDSVQTCANDNATLPTHLTESDNQFLYSFLGGNSWLGLYCPSRNRDNCTWSDGSPLGYSNFRSGYPVANQYGNVNSGWWRTAPEDDANGMGWICQKAGAATPSPVPIPTPCRSGHCPDPSYTLNPDTCKCYKAIPLHLMTYNNSVEYCAKENATLPIILNEADNDFVSDTYNPATWLGLYCTDYSNGCTWQDGTPLEYTFFAWDYPSANQPVYKDRCSDAWYTRSESYPSACVCQKNGVP